MQISVQLLTELGENCIEFLPDSIPVINNENPGDSIVTQTFGSLQEVTRHSDHVDYTLTVNSASDTSLGEYVLAIEFDVEIYIGLTPVTFKSEHPVSFEIYVYCDTTDSANYPVKQATGIKCPGPFNYCSSNYRQDAEGKACD